MNYHWADTWKPGEKEELIEALKTNKFHSDSEWFKKDPVNYVESVFLSQIGSKRLKEIREQSVIKDNVRYTKTLKDFEDIEDILPPSMRFQYNDDSNNLIVKGIKTMHEENV